MPWTLHRRLIGYRPAHPRPRHAAQLRKSSRHGRMAPTEKGLSLVRGLRVCQYSERPAGLIGWFPGMPTDASGRVSWCRSPNRIARHPYRYRYRYRTGWHPSRTDCPGSAGGRHLSRSCRSPRADQDGPLRSAEHCPCRASFCSSRWAFCSVRPCIMSSPLMVRPDTIAWLQQFREDSEISVAFSRKMPQVRVCAPAAWTPTMLASATIAPILIVRSILQSSTLPGVRHGFAARSYLVQNFVCASPLGFASDRAGDQCRSRHGAVDRPT